MDNKVNWTATVKDKTDISLDGIMIVTQKLEITSSVYSLFVVGEWQFTFPTAAPFFEKGILTIGTKLQFDFFPSGKESVSIPLSILSIRNGPGTTAGELGIGYQIALVSPWYFDQFPKSKAYKGTTSEIISQVLEEDLSGSFDDVSIRKSFDTIENRYRTYQTPATFFAERIVKNVRGQNNSTPFFFTTNKNIIQLIDFNQILTTPSYFAVDPYSQVLLKYVNDLQNDTKAQNYFFPQSIIFSFNETEKQLLWSLANPGLIYTYRAITAIKGAKDEPVLTPFTDNFENKFSVINHRKNKTLFSKYFIRDDLDHYEDILSQTIYDYSKELMDSQTVDLLGFPNMFLDIGRMIFLDIVSPVDSKKQSIFSQKYLITTISHVFKQSEGITHLTAALPALAFNADQPELVSQFLTI